jgi:hypothetical protein
LDHYDRLIHIQTPTPAPARRANRQNFGASERFGVRELGEAARTVLVAVYDDAQLGSPEALSGARPVLEAFADPLVHMGALGIGTRRPRRRPS